MEYGDDGKAVERELCGLWTGDWGGFTGGLVGGNVGMGVDWTGWKGKGLVKAVTGWENWLADWKMKSLMDELVNKGWTEEEQRKKKENWWQWDELGRHNR